MKKLRVYIDTSVVGGSFDEMFAQDTKEFLENIWLGKIVPVTSDALVREISEAPEHVQSLFTKLRNHEEYLLTTPETSELALKYIQAQVVTKNFYDDALHIALATTAQVSVLVSWNFKHMVNYRRIQKFNSVNLAEGYNTVDIRSPKEVTI